MVHWFVICKSAIYQVVFFSAMHDWSIARYYVHWFMLVMHSSILKYYLSYSNNFYKSWHLVQPHYTEYIIFILTTWKVNIVCFLCLFGGYFSSFTTEFVPEIFLSHKLKQVTMSAKLSPVRTDFFLSFASLHFWHFDFVYM